jgi:hypothetical protein
MATLYFFLTYLALVKFTDINLLTSIEESFSSQEYWYSTKANLKKTIAS